MDDSYLKSAIKYKHGVHNKYVKHGRKLDDWEYVCTIHETFSKINKDNCFPNLGKSLSDPVNGNKSY